MTTAPPAPPTTGGRSMRSVIAYLAFLGVLLATGIDIALPAFDQIEEGFGGDPSAPLIVTVYFVGMAVGQLVYGPLADRYGRMPAVLSGLVIYSIGAIASALAPSFGVLLIARLGWGLGAAAPAGLRSAIARDLYRGDAMARVTTIMMAVFLLGPVFMPLLGDALIEVAPWRSVFWFSAALASIGLVWCVRFGETLAPENQRPLEFGRFGAGVSAVVGNRLTLGHMLAYTFFSAAFFIFLGSAQPVFDQVFDRSSQFAVFFAAIGLLTIPPLLLNNRMIARFGARRMSMLAAGASTTLAVAAVVPVLLLDGRPNFWLWFVWLVLVASLNTVASPIVIALALEPMGELAGTASSLMFFSGFAFGALLAAVVDSMVETTVTPFVVGYAVYMLIGYCWLTWAGAPERDATST